MKIYVIIPGKGETGGTESLHQCASLLNQLQYDTSIYYIKPHKMEITEKFKQYNVNIADEIVDEYDNMIIVPETYTYFLSKFKNIRKCIWWLSLDYYLVNSTPKNCVNAWMKEKDFASVLRPFAYLYLFARGRLHRHSYHFEDQGTFFHAYNCEYARQYIVKNGVSEDKMVYMCGPINNEFLSNADNMQVKKRDDIILYNPYKGTEFTKKLIKEAESYGLKAEFRPIQNLTPSGIRELMSRAKVYIDFGEFPGPERIPREAVTMGCNILTSKNGSAKNTVDVPIPEFLKFETEEDNIPNIIKMLEKMLLNYDEFYHFYDEYRIKAKNQPKLLHDGILELMHKVSIEE